MVDKKMIADRIRKNPEQYAEYIYAIERNKDDFKKLFDYLMANEPIDKDLKDAAGMRFYPSIIIEALTK